MKASEIVRRAEQIADLVNSDYISHDENEALLNENYKNIYQKIINTNDRYFLKEFDLTTGESFGEGNTTSLSFPLPTDFYQLNLIAYGGEQVFRMTATQPTGTKCYELRKDRLILHACQFDDNLKIEYYPTPEKIILAKEDVDAFRYIFEEGNAWGKIKRIVAVGEQNQVAFEDDALIKWVALDRNNYYQVDNGGELVDDVLFIGDIVVLLNNDKTFTAFYYNKTFDHADYKALFYSDGNLFYIDNTDKLNVFTQAQDELHYSLDNIDPNKESSLFAFLTEADGVSVSSENVITNNLKDVDFYRVKNNTIEKYNCTNETVESLFTCPVKCHAISFFNDKIYCKDDIMRIVFENGEIASSQIDILNSDNKVEEQPKLVTTGVDKLVLNSIETDLSHPQNIFFEMIAYSMAQSYALKQGKDTMAISEKLSQIEEQFFDTLTRDSFQPIRMPNVYNNQGYNRGW